MEKYRKEITWKEFNTEANRFANLLLTRGVKKGDKVAILMMDCISWLPIYFGILKSGAVAVPMNFRFSSDEISYCTDLADVDRSVFGPQFIERITPIKAQIEGSRAISLSARRKRLPNFPTIMKR